MLRARACLSAFLSPNRLGRPQHQQAPLVEREVKHRDDFFLDVGFEIDQQVPATDQIQFWKRGASEIIAYKLCFRNNCFF
jgi:hypothetical protein